ncbi:MAG: hypothetical protein PHN98_01815 [Smithellaceae bacterium]|nr:hypothetical protein [Smithellaceae bacterium]
MKRFGLIFLVIVFSAISSATMAEENYTFDLSEIEKKPYHFGGYIEARPVLYGLDTDAALYKLRFFDDVGRRALLEANGRVLLEGSYEKNIFRVFARLNTDLQYNDHTHGMERTTFYEAYVSAKPLTSVKIDVGKKTLKWGKGYAWNPVAFADRPKDPDDPEQAMEGYIMASADFIRSFEGPLKTVSITPVLFPVYDHINSDFGQNNKLNAAGRLYFLFYDTDIDIIFMTGPSRPDRYGFDFSRNLTTNFEIHGEYAWVTNTRKTVLDSTGMYNLVEQDAHRFLIGLRYLTSFDLTTIIEFYHNSAGFNRDEMKNFFSLISQGFDAYQIKGNRTGLARAMNLAESGYARPNAMRNYLYVRLSQKEPFDILYFTPSLTCMINTDDLSANIMPEILYTGITNLELRLRAGIITGPGDSEFGEKQNDYRIELRAGYYF